MWRGPTGGAEDHSLARVDWYPESNRLLVQRQNRDQKRLDVLSFPVTGGEGRAVFLGAGATAGSSCTTTSISCRSARKSSQRSQRSGHNHLYLYDYDGVLKGPVTAGEWDVAGEFQAPAVRGIDERRGKVYFMATLKTPLERHLYVVDLDEGLTRVPIALTAEDGWSNVTMSADARRFLLSYSDPAQPPLRVVARCRRRSPRLARREPDRRETPVCALSRPPRATGIRHDRCRRRHAALLPAIQARGLRARQALSGGAPGLWRTDGADGTAPLGRASRVAQTAQLFTQRGYGVFTIDNRGSGGRGQKFTEALHRRLGDIEVGDQLQGIASLKSPPCVDPTRISMYGWSYGGTMTLMAMAQPPGAVQRGGRGRARHRLPLYDTHYTERYLGMPPETPEGYRLSNVLGYAGALSARCSSSTAWRTITCCSRTRRY